MPTYATPEYLLVTAAPGALGAAVEAQVANGYAPIGAPTTNAGNLEQVMFRGAVESFTAEYAVTAAVIGPPSTLTISGNHAINFNAGYKFTVIGSTGNDGILTVKSSTYSAPNTIITTEETLASAVGDGKIVAFAPSVGP